MAAPTRKQAPPPSNSRGDLYGLGLTLLTGLAIIPVVLSAFLARGLVFITQKLPGRWRYALLSLFGLAFVLLIVGVILQFTTAPPTTGFAWWELGVPIATERKLIIKLVQKVTLGTLYPLFVVISILGCAGFLAGPLWLGHVLIKRNFIAAYTAYKQKLAADEVVLDPRKAAPIIDWFFLVDRKKLSLRIDRPATSAKYRQERVMLDEHFGIPYATLDKHLAFHGSTGSGKTQTLLLFIADALVLNKPVIFIDGKGDEKLIKQLHDLAGRYNRKFYLFDMDGKGRFKSDQFNPFISNKPGVITDIVLQLFDYTEPHYQAAAKTYFGLLINALMATDTPVTWENILLFSTKEKLIGLIKKQYPEANLKTETQGDKIKVSGKSINNNLMIDLNLLSNVDDRAISGFLARLGSYYALTRNTITANGVTIPQVIAENAIMLFSLNSLDYPEQAHALGRLIVNSLKAAASSNDLTGKSTVVALDEFNVFASEAIIDLLNKTRSKGFQMILAFQSIADLEKISLSFRNQAIENTNAKIVHATNDPQGAEYLAKAMGTFKAQKKTYVADEDDPSGRQSIRVVDEFIAHPNELKTLRAGEAFVKYTELDGRVVVTPKIKIRLLQ